MRTNPGVGGWVSLSKSPNDIPGLASQLGERLWMTG